MSPNERLAARAREVCAKGESNVQSPCVSVCRMSSASHLCLGCFRTLEEIALWGRMDDESKLGVWRSILRRIDRHAAPTMPQRERAEDA